VSDQLQIALGSPEALVRSSDPVTSRLAAFGQKSRDQHLYRVLLAYDGGDAMTDVEASKVSGIDRIETTRRASELRRHSLIAPEKDADGNLRTAVLPTGRRGMLCRITAKGRDALAAGVAA
jgi:hypothetical protein